MELRILIVDDEPLSCARVKRFLGSCPISGQVDSAENAETALRRIHDDLPDVLFLDVEMPGMNGFEMLKKLPAENRPYIVFITAFENYAVRAFDVQAVDYLLKPFSRHRFEEAIQKLLHHFETQPGKQQYAKRIVFRQENELAVMDARDIDWIEAEGRYSVAHLKTKKMLIREGIGSILNRLDPSRFVRIHRSYVVNIDRIQKLQPLFHGDYRVVLQDGTHLVMSRRFKARIQHLLGQPL